VTDAILAVSKLSRSFGGVHAVRDVTLAVPKGELRAIIGPNGAGKTTLFNQIAGELRSDGGSIHVFGEDVTHLPVRRRAHLGVSRTYQVITLFARDTLLHNVVLGMLGVDALRFRPLRRLADEEELRERARAVLATVGLADRADVAAGELAYGEQRRAEIAVALAQRPRLLLLDEPLAGLSRDERALVRDLITGIPRETTIVMIEHDMDVALAFAEQISVLHYGELIVEGDRETVVAHPRTREVYLGG
jgi:branched-chain amino acid transport system ATP-binding protein